MRTHVIVCFLFLFPEYSIITTGEEEGGGRDLTETAVVSITRFLLSLARRAVFLAVCRSPITVAHRCVITLIRIFTDIRDFFNFVYIRTLYAPSPSLNRSLILLARLPLRSARRQSKTLPSGDRRDCRARTYRVFSFAFRSCDE